MSETVEIGNDGLRAKLRPYGAALAGLWMQGVPHSLVLGLDDTDQFACPDLYLGAVLGPVANRIGYGRARLGGSPLVLPVNAAPHHLHGGPGAFSHQAWAVASHAKDAILFELHCNHNDLGYPGDRYITAQYEVFEPYGLRLTLTASTDRDTLMNLAHHPYFDVAGQGSIEDVKLQINADNVLLTDETALPSSVLHPVNGSRFDFRNERWIAGTQLDHCFCLSSEPVGPMKEAARLTGSNGVTLSIATTQPGLQIYTADHFQGEVRDVSGRPLKARSGIAIEAQGWPDAPNHSHFPSVLLRKGQVYRQVTEYRFQKVDQAV